MPAKPLEIVSGGSQTLQEEESPLVRLRYKLAELESDMITLRLAVKMALADAETHAQAAASSLNRTRQIEIRINEKLAELRER